MAVSVRFVRRLLLCAMGVLALAACGSDGVQSPAANSPDGTSASSSETAVAVDTLAFSAPLVGGGSLDFSNYAGTPMLVWFWAPT